jgi:hypothetical protein
MEFLREGLRGLRVALRYRPRRTALALLLPAAVLALALLAAALLRGGRGAALRAAVTLGEGHLTLRASPDRRGQPRLIPDAKPFYTTPALLDAGAHAAPRLTIPVRVRGLHAEARAVLRGVEMELDPQALLVRARVAAGAWPGDDDGAVALGADLAAAIGVAPGGVIAVAEEGPAPQRGPAILRVMGLVRTGEPEFDQHGVWCGLPVARSVLGLPRPRDSETASHLAVYLPGPARARDWKERLARLVQPYPVEIAGWWEQAPLLEPLAPEAGSGLPWRAVALAQALAALAAALALGRLGPPWADSYGGPFRRRLAHHAGRALWAGGVAAALGIALAAGGNWLLAREGVPLWLVEPYLPAPFARYAEWSGPALAPQLALEDIPALGGLTFGLGIAFLLPRALAGGGRGSRRARRRPKGRNDARVKA